MAAPMRFMSVRSFPRFFTYQNRVQILTLRKKLHKEQCVRHHARWFRPMLFALNNQLDKMKKEHGAEPMKPRSAKENWDFDSEVFAFAKRVGEEFDEGALRTALTHPSYIAVEESKRKELGMDQNSELQLADNTRYFDMGATITANYLTVFLHHMFPKLPEEAVLTATEYLMSANVLDNVGKHLGLHDITLCAEFPVPEEITQKSMLAVIGALLESRGVDRAGGFVKDFILAQLMDEELYDIWNPKDPMQILADLLEKEGQSPPEARLLREAGRNTLTPLFVVGIYIDKQLLGWGPGESITVAEEEAAGVALKKLYGIPNNRPPLPLDSTRQTKFHQEVCKVLKEKMNQRQIAAS